MPLAPLAPARRLASALATLTLVVVGAACSSAPNPNGPDGTEETTESTGEAITSCPLGWTHTCTNDGPPGDPIVCSPCIPGLWTKMSSLNGNPNTCFWGGPPPSQAIPSELAGLGCMAGIDADYPIWVCPTASDAKLPHAIPSLSGGVPACSATADAGPVTNCMEVVSFAADGSGCLGTLMANWEYVALEPVPYRNVVAGACNGGCPISASVPPIAKH